MVLTHAVGTPSAAFGSGLGRAASGLRDARVPSMRGLRQVSTNPQDDRAACAFRVAAPGGSLHGSGCREDAWHKGGRSCFRGLLAGRLARVTWAAAAGAALALIGASPAAAEPRELEVDLAHTAVFWKISHGGFSNVMGQFRKIDLVEITFDPEDVGSSKVRASIEAASLDSNHYYRDNFTRSEQS